MFSKLKVMTAAMGMAAVAMFGASSASAGIILSGDVNIANPINGSNGFAVNAGNAQFFTNVLQGGTSVVVLASSETGSPSLVSAGSAIDSHYDSLAGVSSSLVSSTTAITSSLLSGVKLLVAILPEAFTSSEIAVLQAFLSGGGNIFFMGDNSTRPGNSAINSALAALGSGMSLNQNVVGSGTNSALISNHSLTNAVVNLTYATASQVTGGTVLFSTQTAEAIIAAEGFVNNNNINGAVVPIPAAAWMFGSGLVAFAAARRRKAA